MEEPLQIDGSLGEGGGQVLRNSLALSICLHKPVRIFNIRKGRKNPGLRAQHLCCALAAAQICSAGLEGAEVGSTEIFFAPGPVRPGDYTFDTGGAGSCTLVLQAVLPALLTASSPSRIRIKGATHTPMSPPFEYLDRVFIPQIRKMGPSVKARLERYGFNERGGGSILVEITPSQRLSFLEVENTGRLQTTSIYILHHNLRPGLPEMEAEFLPGKLWGEYALAEGMQEFFDQHFQGGVRLMPVPPALAPAEGSCNVIFMESIFARGTRIICAYGGTSLKSAEKAATELAGRRAYYAGYEGNVDRFLADQLIVPLAVGSGGRFSCQKPSGHTETCMELLRLFGGEVRAEPGRLPREWVVTVDSLGVS